MRDVPVGSVFRLQPKRLPRTTADLDFAEAKASRHTRFGRLVLISLIAVPIGGQVLSLRGRVTSSGCGGGPVAGASITVDDHIRMTTGDDGSFEIEMNELSDVAGLPSGDHVIAVSAAGFRTALIRRSAALPTSFHPSSPVSIDLLPRKIADSACETGDRRSFTQAVNESIGILRDDDRDGIDDVVEQWLAFKFAPIVFHGERELNFPTNVDWFLAKTQLWEFDDACEPDRKRLVVGSVKQSDLIGHSFIANCEGSAVVQSDGVRSHCKQATYFLRDLRPEDQVGSSDSPEQWITYVHSYANTLGGITLQYWRFYAHNDDRRHSLRVRIGLGPLSFEKDLVPGHGGDWEGIMVHLDRTLRPASADRLGHEGIERDILSWDGDHPKVWSEEGGHASGSDASAMQSVRFFRHQTWDGGEVTAPDGSSRGRSGGLRNMGEKSRPLNGQVFVRYSGTWGSPGDWFVTSGYWGPAFNETGATCSDGSAAYKTGVPGCSAVRPNCERVFHTAWCKNMDPFSLDLDVECYARAQSR